MIKNYIFDFGWVLVRFDMDYMTRKYIKDENDCQMAQKVIFDRVYWDALDDGTISDQEVKEKIKSRLPKRLWEDACKAYDNWIYNLPFIDGMVDLVKDIKENGGKLFILSNISKEFAQRYKDVPALKELFSLFDGLVFSGPLGIVKPSKEIFEHILSKYSLERQETMFIDDSEKNINGAEAVGIKGYHFDGNAQKLREYIFK
ncbi:MAG: HAD family phosphatase [Ruminococcaceae bacterium]|nr:HAD family phosphatase [Oscillospiraceae bacterium]